jgi:penicillin amidase
MNINENIYRDEHGIPHIKRETKEDLFWGQGYVHATDRGMQMIMMRTLGQGRASELLDSSDEMAGIDKYFRKMNWSGYIAEELRKLPEEIKRYLTAYCNGVNEAFSNKFPWELKLLGVKFEPWKMEDIIAISRMIGYLTLSQSQGEMERLFIEMVQAGINREKLEELFPGILCELDIDLLKNVILNERVVPNYQLWNIAVPRMMASNNWVLSGKKTTSGKAILTNDPHLEVNRLPNVWYELFFEQEDRFVYGATMPGVPGIFVGRSNDLSWGATYSFMDAEDSWIEKCKDGKFYSEESGWLPFQTRKEIIKRKGKESVEVVFNENDHGVLDGDPSIEGFYLATKWASSKSGAVTLINILKLLDAGTVEEGMNCVGKVESSWNFVLADNKGNIGYQMSGLMPKRRDGVSGFVPLPGWNKKNDWNGFESFENLPRAINPDDGFFVTANNDLNKYGNVKPINMPMGHYRAERITQLLNKDKKFSVEDIFQMHMDVYSIQAETFMKIAKPLLPDTENGKILIDWDCKYNPESEGAYLFEEFYKELYREVFGKNNMGIEVIDFLKQETGTFADFYLNFDRILLMETSSWFNGQTREDIYKKSLEKILKIKTKKWGDVQKVILKHLIFGGKLPVFLGFDRGPITIIGGRATIHQGQIYRSANRETTFAPGFRFVMDFAKEEFFSAMAGGPSERRFSKWYASGLKDWIKGKYKTLKLNPKIKIKFK